MKPLIYSSLALALLASVGANAEIQMQNAPSGAAPMVPVDRSSPARDSACAQLPASAPNYVHEACKIRGVVMAGQLTVIHFYDNSEAVDNITAQSVFTLLKAKFVSDYRFVTANVKANVVLSKYFPHRYFQWDGQFASSSIGVFDREGILIQLFRVNRTENISELERRIENFLKNTSRFVTSREDLLRKLEGALPVLLVFVHEYSDALRNLFSALDSVCSVSNCGEVVIVPVSSDAASLMQAMANAAIAQGSVGAHAIFEKGSKRTLFTQVYLHQSYNRVAENLRSALFFYKDSI